jgi:O-antigen/teichoic acid export membrane protein
VLRQHHASGRKGEFWRTWNDLVAPWSLLGALLFWAVFLSADDIVHVALGARFAAAAAVLRIYTLILPLRMAAFTAPLRAAGFTWLDVVASVTFGIVSLVVGSIGARTAGPIGPAAGLVAGYVAWVGVNIAGTARILDARVSEMLPIRGMTITLAVGGAGALLPWAVSRALAPTPGAPRLATFLAGYGAITAVALFTSAQRRRRTAGRTIQ